jgi:hypothetical protein
MPMKPRMLCIAVSSSPASCSQIGSAKQSAARCAPADCPNTIKSSGFPPYLPMFLQVHAIAPAQIQHEQQLVAKPEQHGILLMNFKALTGDITHLLWVLYFWCKSVADHNTYEASSSASSANITVQNIRCHQVSSITLE